MAAEVLEAMSFLGIKSELFSSLKKQYGGLVELHAAMANLLCA